MPTTVELDPRVTRVLAPNASPMTLDGTNTYLVGEPRAGVVLLVDPGPEDPEHLAAVEAAIAELDAEVALILVTHHHRDHAEAALAWASRFGCRVAAARPDVAGPDGLVLGAEDLVAMPGSGATVAVVATPGHSADHLAFRLPHGPLLTGDHILGRGTSVVAYPDGDLGAYLESLRRVLGVGPDALYPGHGPELVAGDATEVIAYYRAHREFRMRQIIAVLARAPHTPRELVARIYADVDRGLWDAAELSTRAAVEELQRQGVVALEEDIARLVDAGG
ncbi:MAG: MBL fold metallo-hydrolase [Actinobacteria bacterium]|nr:MBL fold metallo-hydrolase [Actinomycetota bacterium]